MLTLLLLQGQQVLLFQGVLELWKRRRWHILQLRKPSVPILWIVQFHFQRLLALLVFHFRRSLAARKVPHIKVLRLQIRQSPLPMRLIQHARCKLIYFYQFSSRLLKSER